MSITNFLVKDEENPNIVSGMKVLGLALMGAGVACLAFLGFCGAVGIGATIAPIGALLLFLGCGGLTAGGITWVSGFLEHKKPNI